MSAARILPPEEWDRLGDDLQAFYRTMDPADVAVVVVEDGGAIVARMGVFRVPHWDTFWMAPEAAGNAGITRALLRAASAQAFAWAPWFYANADSDETMSTIERLGGQWMPMHTFLLSRQQVPMEDSECRKQ